MEIKYILNHFYKLRHDLKRTYLLSSNDVNKKYTDCVQHEWMSRIHPVIAMALTLFDEPQTLSELKEVFSSFFNMPENEAEDFIKLFLDNAETFTIDYDGVSNYLPKNIVIDVAEQFAAPIHYSPEQFAYKELDFKRERPYFAPFTLVFMVNNTCATDCVYCYADKSVKATPIAFERLKTIVEEARELNVTKFAVVGGEVLLYKQWKELFRLLQENNLGETMISTKVPIDEETVIALKEFDLRVQISLDAINSSRLQQILNVGSTYAEKIRHTIGLLEKHQVTFQVATVLTKYNHCIEDLNAIYKFLSQFERLRRWEIRVAFKSLYSRGDFDKFKLSHEDVNQVDVWVKDVQQKTKMHILWSSSAENKYFKGEKGSRSFQGSRCSANYSNLFILPDGKVSICEQLYWNPRFIIGDLTKQSIKEIWNSPEALRLAFPRREDFRESSVCKTCGLFDECMDFPNRCIADVLKGYGMDNWDYPDPRCCKAPQFIHNLLSE